MTRSAVRRHRDNLSGTRKLREVVNAASVASVHVPGRYRVTARYAMLMDLHDQFLEDLNDDHTCRRRVRLWTFRKDGRAFSCVLRDEGGRGVEAQILIDDDVRFERRFDTKELAQDWAMLELVDWLFANSRIIAERVAGRPTH